MESLPRDCLTVINKRWAFPGPPTIFEAVPSSLPELPDFGSRFEKIILAVKESWAFFGQSAGSEVEEKIPTMCSWPFLFFVFLVLFVSSFLHVIYIYIHIHIYIYTYIYIYTNLLFVIYVTLNIYIYIDPRAPAWRTEISGVVNFDDVMDEGRYYLGPLAVEKVGKLRVKAVLGSHFGWDW